MKLDVDINRNIEKTIGYSSICFPKTVPSGTCLLWDRYKVFH